MLTNITAIIAAFAAVVQVLIINKMQRYERSIGNRKFLHKKLDTYYNRLALFSGIGYYISVLSFFAFIFLANEYFRLMLPEIEVFAGTYLIFILFYLLSPLFLFLYSQLRNRNLGYKLISKAPLWILKVKFFAFIRNDRNEEKLYTSVIVKNVILLSIVCIATLTFNFLNKIQEEATALVFLFFISVGFIIYALMSSIELYVLKRKAGSLRSIAITLKNGTVFEVTEMKVEGPFILYSESNHSSFTNNMLNVAEVKKIEEHYSKALLILDEFEEYITQISYFLENKQSSSTIVKEIIYLDRAIDLIEDCQKNASWRELDILERIFIYLPDFKQKKARLLEELQSKKT